MERPCLGSERSSDTVVSSSGHENAWARHQGTAEIRTWFAIGPLLSAFVSSLFIPAAAVDIGSCVHGHIGRICSTHKACRGRSSSFDFSVVVQVVLMGFIEVRSSISHTAPISLESHHPACDQAVPIGPYMHVLAA